MHVTVRQLKEELESVESEVPLMTPLYDIIVRLNYVHREAYSVVLT